MILCKEKAHSKKEYDRLCTEMYQCRDMAFSHGTLLVTLFFGYIGAILAITGEKLETIFSKQESSGILMMLVGVILFSVPLFIIYPAVLKFHDNVRTMACVGAYIKVFYELPSMFHAEKEKKTKADSDDGIIAWESWRIQSVIPNAKWIVREYFILAIIASFASAFLTLFFIIYYLLHRSQNGYENFGLFITVAMGCLVAVFFNFIFTFWKIRANSDVKMMFTVYPNVYLTEYLKRAVDFQLITEDDRTKYLKLVSYSQNRDRKIPEMIKRAKQEM